MASLSSAGIPTAQLTGVSGNSPLQALERQTSLRPVELMADTTLALPVATRRLVRTANPRTVLVRARLGGRARPGDRLDLPRWPGDRLGTRGRAARQA